MEGDRKRQFLKFPSAPADYEHPADENDTLATLKKQHLEILDRLDRLHDSVDILTRMSFRSESIPESIQPKGIGQAWLGAVETVIFIHFRQSGSCVEGEERVSISCRAVPCRSIATKPYWYCSHSTGQRTAVPRRTVEKKVEQLTVLFSFVPQNVSLKLEDWAVTASKFTEGM